MKSTKLAPIRPGEILREEFSSPALSRKTRRPADCGGHRDRIRHFSAMRVIACILLSVIAGPMLADSLPLTTNAWRYVDAQPHDLRHYLNYLRPGSKVPRPDTEWIMLRGEFVGRTKTGILLQEFTTADMTETRRLRQPNAQEKIGFSFGKGKTDATAARTVTVGTQTNYGSLLHLANYPMPEILTSGEVIEAAALPRKAAFLHGAQQLKAFDYGQLPSAKQLVEINAKLTEQQQAREAAQREAAAKTEALRTEKQAALDAKTAAFYRKRADSGDAVAQYELARRHLSGKGVEQDEKEAVRLLKLAAAQGYKPAQNQLDGMPSVKQ